MENSRVRAITYYCSIDKKYYITIQYPYVVYARFPCIPMVSVYSNMPVLSS